VASTALGRISAAAVEHTLTGVNPPTIEWLYFPNPRAPEFLSFNTPVGMAEAQQCGKVLYADVHIQNSVTTPAGTGGGDDSNVDKPFPSGCKINGMSPQQKALEFLFFDLGACL
jgi:hypothetical protein